VQTTSGRPQRTYSREQLELIEQAIERLAAQSEPDVSLLAKLDRIRAEVRRALSSG
jgi:hypothetical protein